MKEYIQNTIFLRFDNINITDKIDLEKVDTDFILSCSEHYDYKKFKNESYSVELISCNKEKIIIKYSVVAYSDYISRYDRFMVNHYNSISKIEDWADTSSTALKQRDILNLKNTIFEIEYLEEKNIKKQKQKVII